jgi:hypothetical protein
MFHNYGYGGNHTSERDLPSARNAKRLAKKKGINKRLKRTQSA